MHMHKNKTTLLLILISLMGFVQHLSAQTAGDYRSIASGNWKELSVWQIYTTAGWRTPTELEGAPKSTSGVINISANTKVVVTDTVIADQVWVLTGGELSIANTASFTLNYLGGTDLYVFGGLEVSGNFVLNKSRVIFQTGSILRCNIPSWTFSSAISWHPNALIECASGSATELLFPTSATLARIAVKNNTSLKISAVKDPIVLQVPNGVGADIFVESGSVLAISPSVKSLVAGKASSIDINGVLQNSSAIDLTADMVKCTITGKVENSGTFPGNIASKLIFTDNSLYEHKIDSGIVPLSTWSEKSTISLPGIQNSFPAGLNQSFGNMVIDPTLKADIAIKTSLDIRGNLTLALPVDRRVIVNNNDSIHYTIFVGKDFYLESGSLLLSASKGTASLQVGNDFYQYAGNLFIKSSSGNALIFVTGNFVKTGGNFFFRSVDLLAATGESKMLIRKDFEHTAGNFNFSQSAGDGEMQLAGNFRHVGGLITETGTGKGIIRFNGSNSQQLFDAVASITNTVDFTIDSLAYVQMATANTRVTGTGTFTVESGATLGIRATGGITLAPSTVGQIVNTTRIYKSGSNYIYNGNVAQNTGTAFQTCMPASVVFDNPTLVYQSTNMEVTGDVRILQGELSTRNFHLKVAGNWLNNGKYNPNTSSQITFNGIKQQQVGGTQVTAFLTMLVDNPEGLSLQQNLQVNTQLTMLNGVVIPNDYALILGLNAKPIAGAPFSANKMIVMNEKSEVRKLANNATQATYSFPIGNINTGKKYYSPIQFLFTGGTYLGYYSVKVIDAKHPQNPDPVNYLTRYWTVRQEGFKLFSAALTAEFDSSDITGSRDALRLSKYNETNTVPWTNFPVAPTGNSFYVAGITSFSDFTGFGSAVTAKTTLRTVNNSSGITATDSRITKTGPPVMSVYPNPVVGRTVNLAFNNFSAGRYEMVITNNLGQRVIAQTVQHNGGNTTQKIQMPSGSKGVYRVQLNGEGENLISSFIVE